MRSERFFFNGNHLLRFGCFHDAQNNFQRFQSIFSCDERLLVQADGIDEGIDDAARSLVAVRLDRFELIVHFFARSQDELELILIVVIDRFS